jgi:arsenate reductase-like glutaredoxin family protein
MASGSSNGLLRGLAELARKFQLTYRLPAKQAQYLAIGYFLLTGSLELPELPRIEELMDSIKKEFNGPEEEIYKRFLELYGSQVLSELSNEEKDLLKSLNPDQELYTLEKLLRLMMTDNLVLVSRLLGSLEDKGLMARADPRVWYRDLNERVILLPLGKQLAKLLKGQE